MDKAMRHPDGKVTACDAGLWVAVDTVHTTQRLAAIAILLGLAALVVSLGTLAVVGLWLMR